MTRRTASFSVLAAFSGGALRAALPRTAGDLDVKLADGKTVSLSSYRGKVLVFGCILTTCSHCKMTARILSKLHQEMAPRGLGVLLGALNEKPDLAGFAKELNLPYPVGSCDHAKARKFMGLPDAQLRLVPWLTFIDPSGLIKQQFTGVDSSILTSEADQQEVNLRKVLDSMLPPAKPQAPAYKKAPRDPKPGVKQ